MKKILTYLTLITLMAAPILEAKSYSSGSRSYSSPSRSYSSPSRSSSSKSSWSSKPKSSGSKSTWGQKKTAAPAKKTVAPKRSSAQEAAYKKAAKSGTAFKSKKAATADFKSKNASKYKSSYATKPATRPDYIPQTTSVGGNSYNVSYNAGYGGYGYMGPMGTWVMYDAMADAATLSLLMSRQGYYYDNPTVRSTPVVIHRSGPSGFVVVMGFVIFLVVVGASIIVINKS